MTCGLRNDLDCNRAKIMLNSSVVDCQVSVNKYMDHAGKVSWPAAEEQG